nr:type I secretion system permease/ATPase [Ramlibacter rhizophilus]
MRALCAVARFHHVAGDPVSLAHQLALPPRELPPAQDMVRAARHLGLRARRVRMEPAALAATPLPALVLLEDGGTRRWAVLARCDGQQVILQSFGTGADGPQLWPLARLAACWPGELVLLTRRASLPEALARFDFSWFIPSLVKYRKLLGEVLAISFFLQLFALVSPLFFQVVMDKVLVHRGLATLDVLVIGLVVVVLFESLLTAMRSFVFSHTTSRIDVELGSRLFRHLVQLPLAYFQARRVGDSVARVRELENIRAFLTGSGLTVAMDLVFSLVFVAVMAFYSLTLTLIVLASVPLYAAISLAVVPVLRRRLDEKFARGAENQALLVETVTGVQTVKAGALEPGFAAHWDRQLAAYVQASFRAQTLASWAHEATHLVGKLVQAATLWWGAHQVMAGALTVGEFVAFNMFAQRVAQPVLRLAQLWTDFQQTGIAVARLGDILDTPTERPPAQAAQLPTLRGHIRLEGVTFRYRPEASPVLQDLSLELRPGEVLGVVGRSGSGKSTLAKLVQRLHVPERGRVLVDGIDIALADADQLRRQVGVVLQENLLFNRSVRENIAIADPAAPLDAVVQVARMAGAHEFICELPQGYDTVVGEQGASLSGGQRQRIAIARALFTRPRILILDEATSALDYESEAMVQRNMAHICRGRTVLVIAHRLSTVRRADRIVVMERGAVLESGTHEALLARPNGAYARLWALQQTGAGAAATLA